MSDSYFEGSVVYALTVQLLLTCCYNLHNYVNLVADKVVSSRHIYTTRLKLPIILAERLILLHSVIGISDLLVTQVIHPSQNPVYIPLKLLVSSSYVWSKVMMYI